MGSSERASGRSAQRSKSRPSIVRTLDTGGIYHIDDNELDGCSLWRAPRTDRLRSHPRRAPNTSAEHVIGAHRRVLGTNPSPRRPEEARQVTPDWWHGCVAVVGPPRYIDAWPSTRRHGARPCTRAATPDPPEVGEIARTRPLPHPATTCPEPSRPRGGVPLQRAISANPGVPVRHVGGDESEHAPSARRARATCHGSTPPPRSPAWMWVSGRAARPRRRDRGLREADRLEALGWWRRGGAAPRGAGAAGGGCWRGASGRWIRRRWERNKSRTKDVRLRDACATFPYSNYHAWRERFRATVLPQ